MICAVEYCERQHHARGWCSMHYKRWWAYGDPEVDLGALRFWRKVHVGEDCWLWQASTTGGGYGQARYGGKRYMAHRLALLLSGVDIPSGVDVHHLCQQPLCVRLDHLTIISKEDHGVSHGGWQRTKVCCPRGHPYDEENTRWYRNMRYCRACRRGGDRARKTMLSITAPTHPTNEQKLVRAARIIQLHGEGASISRIAKEFHMRRETVSGIIGGST